MLRKLWTLVFAVASIFSLMALINLSAYASRGQTNDFRAKAGPHMPAVGYVVNNLDDINDGICDLSYCSLREAITAANSNAGADTITFSVSGTITLTSSLPPISDTLSIDSSGQNITISGANAYQVMYVNNGATLTLNALTVADGYSSYGGGLDNHGSLTVTNSTFSDNSAVYGSGLNNENSGTAVISNTTFSANHLVWPCPCPGGGNGGGIHNSGMLAVTNSTFANNGNSGGGAVGGGVYNVGLFTVTNSTFSGNTAPFGGGIVNYGTATVQNTIMANSFGNNCDGTVVNGGNNLDSDGSCGWGSTDGSLSHVDPHLGPLSDYGGSTQTFKLWPDSPAIDAVIFNAPNGCPATDQRGVARPIGPRCDIGAYESNVVTHRFLPLIARNFVVALVVNRMAGDVSTPGR
jgi:CSLREA domain-containing protein